MKLTLMCDCGNSETITINTVRMADYADTEDSIYIVDFETKGKKFYHHQSHPDESEITCSNCSKSMNLNI